MSEAENRLKKDAEETPAPPLISESDRTIPPSDSETHGGQSSEQTIPPSESVDQSPEAINSPDQTIPPSAASSAETNAEAFNDQTILPSASTPPVGSTSAVDTHHSNTFGDYEIIQEIARGGMGVVYKARQVSLNRTVALKKILSGQLAGDEDLKRFQVEAEASAQLDHVGIVPVYDFGQVNGQYYFSMGFVEGDDLAERIRERPMEAEAAAAMMIKIAQAVGYANAKGVIHRDLKPSNVLLDGNNEPKVTDFGVAKQQGNDSEMTAQGQILGTPSYMPPEQAAGQGDVVDQRADVYALGAILYALLTGRPPFQAATAMETMIQVLDQDPVPISQLNSTIPRDLETICLKCLQKEPAKRYASAEALADDLQRYLNDEPIVARPPTRVEQLGRWIRKNRATAIGTGLVAATLIVATIISISYAFEAARQRDEAASQRDTANLAKQEADDQRRMASEQRDAADLAKIEADAQRDAAIHQAYIVNIQGAFFAQEQKNLAVTRERLEMARDVLKNPLVEEMPFEWGMLNRNCDIQNSSSAFNGHQGIVFDVDFSPDGKRLVSCSDDHFVQIWDVKTSKLIQSLKGHDDQVMAVAFSPDGSLIASAGKDCSVLIWDANRGELVSTLKGHSREIMSLAFSPDGKYLASAGSHDFTVKVWNVESSSELMTLQGHTRYVTSVAFSPDGKRIASGCYDSTVRIWNADTGEHLKTLKEARGLTGSQSVNSVAFSPDGKLLATACADNVVRMWDAETGELAIVFEGHSFSVSSISFSPDGTRLASSSIDKTIRLWNVQTGEHLETLFGHEKGVMCLAFNTDGTQLASGGLDGNIRIWNTKLDKDFSVLEGHTWAVDSISFSSDGMRIATGSWDDTIRVWDGESFELIGLLEGHTDNVRSVAFHPSSNRLASGSDDKTIRIWDVFAMEHLVTLSGHTAIVTAVSFSPNGQLLASSDFNNGVHIWDVETAKCIKTLDLKAANPEVIESLSFMPDGDQLVIGGRNNVSIFSWKSNEQIMTFKGPQRRSDQEITRLREDYLGKYRELIKNREPDKAQKFSMKIGELQEEKLKASIFCMACSSDGKSVAAGFGNNAIWIWNARSGEKIGVFRGHTESVSALSFSPDGSRLASGSKDETIRIWDLQSGAQLVRLKGPASGIKSLAFSKDGKKLASGSGDIFRPSQLDKKTGRHVPLGVETGSQDNKVRIWQAN